MGNWLVFSLMMSTWLGSQNKYQKWSTTNRTVCVTLTTVDNLMTGLASLPIPLNLPNFHKLLSKSCKKRVTIKLNATTDSYWIFWPRANSIRAFLWHKWHILSSYTTFVRALTLNRHWLLRKRILIMRLTQLVGGSTGPGCSLLRFYWRENLFN